MNWSTSNIMIILPAFSLLAMQGITSSFTLISRVFSPGATEIYKIQIITNSLAISMLPMAWSKFSIFMNSLVLPLLPLKWRTPSTIHLPFHCYQWSTSSIPMNSSSLFLLPMQGNKSSIIWSALAISLLPLKWGTCIYSIIVKYLVYFMLQHGVKHSHHCSD